MQVLEQNHGTLCTVTVQSKKDSEFNLKILKWQQILRVEGHCGSREKKQKNKVTNSHKVTVIIAPITVSKYQICRANKSESELNATGTVGERSGAVLLATCTHDTNSLCGSVESQTPGRNTGTQKRRKEKIYIVWRYKKRGRTAGRSTSCSQRWQRFLFLLSRSLFKNVFVMHMLLHSESNTLSRDVIVLEHFLGSDASLSLLWVSDIQFMETNRKCCFLLYNSSLRLLSLFTPLQKGYI